MVLGTLWTIIIVIVAIIIIVALLRFLFGILFIAPTGIEQLATNVIDANTLTFMQTR
jgi:hypothetical protein